MRLSRANNISLFKQKIELDHSLVTDWAVYEAEVPNQCRFMRTSKAIRRTRTYLLNLLKFENSHLLLYTEMGDEEHPPPLCGIMGYDSVLSSWRYAPKIARFTWLDSWVPKRLARY